MDPRDSSDPHAGDHGQHRNPFAIIVDALEGTTGHDWCQDVSTDRSETCSQQIEAAFQAAGLAEDAIAHVEDIEQTSQHMSPFTSLGLGPSYEIPMTNRATYYHFHVGSNVEESRSLLPPGASGHVSLAQTPSLLAQGEAPQQMEDQLDRYVDFNLKDGAWTQAEAERGEGTGSELWIPSVE